MIDNPKGSFRKIAIAAARAGDDKKADPVKVYDLAGSSPLADFAVLLGADSAPQLEAIEQEVSVRLKREGIFCLHKDGGRSRSWKVMDYGGTLVHIFDGKAAEFYAIDKLFEKARPVEWQEKAPAAPAPAAPAKKASAKKKPAAKKPAKKAASGKPAKKAVPKKAAKKAAPKKAAKKPVRKPAKKSAKASKKK